MPVGALTMSEDLKQQILLDLCRRNHCGELTCTLDDHRLLQGKIRFLNLSPKGLIMDRPTLTGPPAHLSKNEFIHVRFQWEEQHYSFITQVQTELTWELNDSVSVDAMQVKMPKDLKRTQRRNYYRLGLAHLPASEIVLLSDENPKFPIIGTIVNISEGGSLILLDKESASKIAVGEIYEASFVLPGKNDPADELITYRLAATVRRIQKLPNRPRFRVGIRWNLDPTDREIQVGLGRYIIAEQLRTLRRRQMVMTL